MCNKGFTHLQIEWKPWLRGFCPQIPILSVLNWICWTPSNKIPGYTTAPVTYMLVTCVISLRPWFPDNLSASTFVHHLDSLLVTYLLYSFSYFIVEDVEAFLICFYFLFMYGVQFFQLITWIIELSNIFLYMRKTQKWIRRAPTEWIYVDE
jgi:hypothetical protein